jgi:hypothetical protein
MPDRYTEQTRKMSEAYVDSILEEITVPGQTENVALLTVALDERSLVLCMFSPCIVAICRKKNPLISKAPFGRDPSIMLECSVSKPALLSLI